MLPPAVYQEGAVILFQHTKIKSVVPGTANFTIKIGWVSHSRSAKEDLKGKEMPKNGSVTFSTLSKKAVISCFHPL